MDLLWILDGFGSHVGDHFGIKIASKNRSKNRSDFGWILEGFWLPNGVKVGPILAPKIDQKARSIFERFLKNRGDGSAAEAGLRRVLFFAQRLIYLDIEYDSVFYTPKQHLEGAAAD